MRFQAAHKLVTYLLVLSALAALGTTRVLAPASALAFLIVCACSFGVDAGAPRLTAALDRAAGGVRAATGLLLVAIVWRIWRRMPDADLAPAFDLVLVLLGYKLLYRRNHRDYVHIYALSFILVLVASTITATFLFMAAFAVYVVLATWALILFHLRREMEENYLVRHSAQAPSQKVGIGRILGSRRVVGRAFFAATFVVAAAVFVGALCVFAFVPRLGAGFVLGARAQPNLIGLSDEVALGRYGTAAGARHAVVLRATLPRLRALGSEAARQDAAERLYFRGAVYDTYDRGRWLRSRRPELRTVIDEAGGRAFIHELGEEADARHAGRRRATGDRSGRHSGGGPVRRRSPGGDRAAVDAARGRRDRRRGAALVGRGRAARRRRRPERLRRRIRHPGPRALRRLLAPARAGRAGPRRARAARQPRAARRAAGAEGARGAARRRARQD